MVFLDGLFLPDRDAKVSVFDRGFLYGDGLFETVRVQHGRLFRWERHLRRFAEGAAALGITIPFPADLLARAAKKLIASSQAEDALIRITMSRGTGKPGYSPSGAVAPLLAMTLRETPGVDPSVAVQWRLITSSLRVPADDPLAQIKSCNKLHHIMARAQAESRGADEAILLNTREEVAEAAAANVFWIDRGTVCTTPPASGALPGVTRELLLELCARLDVPAVERRCLPADLLRAEGVFLTLSSNGIVEAVAIDGQHLACSELTHRLHGQLQELVRREAEAQA